MKRLIVICLSCFLLYSCGHVDNLKQYQLSGKTYLFEQIIAGDPNEVVIIERFDHHGEPDGFAFVAEAAILVGKAVLGHKSEDKLAEASDPDEIVYNISLGFEKNLNRILKVNSVRNNSLEADYLVTTVLDQCKLSSRPGGIFMNIHSTVSIIDRQTGKTVWEYCRSSEEPVRKTSANHLIPNSTISNIIQGSQLATVSKQEIKEAIMATASEVGWRISRHFRNDLSE